MPELPPPVTISGGAPPPPPAPQPGWSRRTRRLVAGAAGVLLLGYVASAVHAASRRRETAVAVVAARNEADALKLVIPGPASVPAEQGRPGEAVQDAKVLLDVRNDGPAAVRVLATTLDGTAERVDVQLDPGATAALPVRWEVRCAEVGSLTGPRLLDLHVRGSAGVHDVQLRLPFVPRLHLPSGDLARVFHRAAVQACDVLVPAKG